ncbi:hypothetical protein F9K88_16720 [Brucella intermedia]|uniref:Secreted protein n=1 Tax=Brucella intermedia M86 TaxID=1234597 RepID=M5JPC3_9HYPH|nr:hypothetical protein [Brucella intermedia]PJT25080.1 hypothetical protein CN884_09345 [Ochrobactrum sp. 30A/1000/2015]PJT40530.1 hypothetical protein CN883_03330 [Ochrobactrum sp. 27A/999/2015]PJT42833.1 hypothetical protein CN882_12720 [Ochrobactrum sp. 23A/997/2015]ELT49162.1 hypothetical protein D584_10307 [Brucella intermedia M86]KAB2709207.1 hypothetical protein F9K88_16720 [Brucella intermedia]
MFSRNRLSAISCGLISSIFLFSHSMAGASETGDLSSRDRTDLLQSAGIDCGAKGNGDCVAGNTERGDYYDVRVYGDCAKAAYFGRTNDKSTSLRKDVATTGTEGKTEGELAPNQLVCIRAAAQVGMHETEYFVMALPMDYGPECKGGELCKKPAPLPTRYQSIMAKCRQDSIKGYIDCPQGWVFADDMEAYSNGLSGEE